MSDAQQADLIVRNVDWLITVDAGRRIIRDTIWHEVGHHFGMSDEEIRRAGK